MADVRLRRCTHWPVLLRSKWEIWRVGLARARPAKARCGGDILGAFVQCIAGGGVAVDHGDNAECVSVSKSGLLLSHRAARGGGNVVESSNGGSIFRSPWVLCHSTGFIFRSEPR